MTEEEINEAFRRVGQPIQQAQSVPTQAPPVPAPYPTQLQPYTPAGPVSVSLPWKSLAVLLLICGGIGSSLHFVFRVKDPKVELILPLEIHPSFHSKQDLQDPTSTYEKRS